MFRREHHQKVVAVLGALRSDVLARCRFWFGGGTRIVLELDEYRESRDIDFLCSDAAGYGELRLLASTGSYPALFTEEGCARLGFPREIRIDQYGIRFPVQLDGESLKVELIREARIELSAGVRPAWSPVDCLVIADCYAEKLLASSDRWADRQFLSRDLLDLAALRATCGPIPETAWEKAEKAYRSAPRDDLRKALTAFERDDSYQARCFAGLAAAEPARLREGLAALHKDLGLPATVD
jgi:Nucleotidyl transferase AbiEii toxin, Type IV TA system